MKKEKNKEIFSFNKKGVSPVIATILLISLTVVIGVIIFLWFRGMTQETITKLGGKNIELVCGEVQFNADYSGGKLYLSNTGNVPIFEFDIEENRGSSYSTKSIKELSENWPSQGLNQGGSFSEDISLDSNIEKIILIPVLIGNSEKGKKAFLCDKNQYGYELLIK
jgi:flagellin-like protein